MYYYIHVLFISECCNNGMSTMYYTLIYNGMYYTLIHTGMYYTLGAFAGRSDSKHRSEKGGGYYTYWHVLYLMTLCMYYT